MDGALVRCSKRFGRPGLPTALNSVNQAELLCSSVRARAVAMESGSGSRMTDVGADAASAEGPRGEDLEPSSTVVLAVNFHSENFEVGDAPEFVKRLVTEGGRTELLRPFVFFERGKAAPTGATAAHMERGHLYIFVMLLPGVFGCLRERRLEKANKFHVCEHGQIGFMCTTPCPCPGAAILPNRRFLVSRWLR